MSYFIFCFHGFFFIFNNKNLICDIAILATLLWFIIHIINDIRIFLLFLLLILIIKAMFEWTKYTNKVVKN